MFNYYPYQNPYQGYNQFNQPVPQVQSMQPKTNKIWVTSVEDALAKSVELNSEYVYLHQDKPLLIEVRTDNQGRKTTRVLEMKDYIEQSKPENNVGNNFPTREEFNGLKAEFQALKDKLGKETKEITE